MTQKKGFSLVEVLASLLLVTTLALSLIQQQLQSKQLLNQLILREQGSQFLDQIDEALLARLNKFPLIPSPYSFKITKHHQKIILHLEWYKNGNGIVRKLIQG